MLVNINKHESFKSNRCLESSFSFFSCLQIKKKDPLVQWKGFGIWPFVMLPSKFFVLLFSAPVDLLVFLWTSWEVATTWTSKRKASRIILIKNRKLAHEKKTAEFKLLSKWKAEQRVLQASKPGRTTVHLWCNTAFTVLTMPNNGVTHLPLSFVINSRTVGFL